MDVSEAGIGISMNDALPPATNCMVSFDVIDEGTRRRVNAWGKVVYCTARAPAVRAGIQFMDMDSNSKLLLRRIPV